MDMNEAQFRQRLHEQGYGEAQVVEFEPNTAREMHTHDFSAFVLVTSGAFTLVTEDDSVTHQPGEACTLAAGTLHSEQTGAEGATILLGKK
jgi:quercetin dioxygenase-like cupin family protein